MDLDIFKQNNLEKMEQEIEALTIDEILKESLIKINHQLTNLKIHHEEFNFKITIENVDESTTKILIDYLIAILKENEVYTDESMTIYEEEETHLRNYGKLFIISNFKKFYNNELLHYSSTKEDIIKYRCPLIIGCEDYLQNYYNKNFNSDTFNDRIHFKIIGKDYTPEELKEQLKKKYSEKNIKWSVSDKYLTELIKSYLKEKRCLNSTCVQYLYKESFNEMILQEKNEIDADCFLKKIETNQKALELDELIGLKNVKEEINTLKNFLAFRKKLPKDIKNTYLNMLFLGNPGTGKTTVARIYAEILYNLGYIKENKLIEIIPTDLMANYVGQTKDQTRRILNKAEGGVLFIDEAYLINDGTYSDGFKSYMDEAVTELIKYMENPNHVVIFAGYPKETKKIYDKNPGIKSRICKEILFEDFNEEELLTIIKKDLKEIGLKIDNKAEKEIKRVVKEQREQKNFGNARFCKTYLQEILMNHANKNLKNETFTITKEDVKKEEEKKFPFGFIGEN